MEQVNVSPEAEAKMRPESYAVATRRTRPVPASEEGQRPGEEASGSQPRLKSCEVGAIDGQIMQYTQFLLSFHEPQLRGTLRVGGTGSGPL